MTEDKDLRGIVTSRICPTCGHHEVGYTGMGGIFYPLKPGTPIRVLKEPAIGALDAILSLAEHSQGVTAPGLSDEFARLDVDTGL